MQVHDFLLHGTWADKLSGCYPGKSNDSQGRGEGVNLARALFAPRAVALIGASGDAAKNTARPQRFLKKHGYAGRVLPINPARAEVLGERAWPSVDRKSTRLNSSHSSISYAVFCLKKKKK